MVLPGSRRQDFSTQSRCIRMIYLIFFKNFEFFRDNCKVVGTGLLVCQTNHWLAVSADGIVF